MSSEKLKIPVFDGHYDHWKEMMENLLRAKQLWNLIEPGIIEPGTGVAPSEAQRKTLADLRTKDLQVKHYLYQAIDRVTFEQILDRRSAKSIWDAMKQRYEGNARVKKSMLQKLRRDFEVLEMKTTESIPDYFGRVLTVANQMRSNGEVMTDLKIVEKILRTLTEKYMYVVVSIEESKDIERMSIDELQSTLLVHEQKFKKPEKDEEQVFKVEQGDHSGTRGRGRGRGSPRGRGRGRGRQTMNRETVECYRCHKLGHFSYECPDSKEANYAGFDEEEEVMLMARVDLSDESNDEVLDAPKKVSMFMAQTGNERSNCLWFLDSGCSNHMCGDKKKFTNLDESYSHSVKLGNNTRMKVGGKGQIKLIFDGVAYVISDVYCVPELKNNLLSMGQLQERGLVFVIKNGTCKIYHNDRGLLFESFMTANRMFPLCEQVYEHCTNSTTACDVSEKGKSKGRVVDQSLYSSDVDISKLWHERYGHISTTSMRLLQQKAMVRGMPYFIVNDALCVDCCVGKQSRKVIPKSSDWRAKDVLELVHSDICGPIKPTSQSGKRYILSFIDDYSRKAWVYLLKEKSETFENFKVFKSKVETETGKKVKGLRTDRGGEYLSEEFKRFCMDHGIKRQLTTSFTPQQNGVAERKNRTVMNMVVTLLAAKNMPKCFWAEAVVWSYYILNRCPTKALKDITPQEAWNGEKPNVEDLRVWGCLAYAHIPKEKRTKLDSKGMRCILVGKSEESKAYRLIDPKTMKVVISKDVLFEENRSWDWGANKKEKDVEALAWEDNEETQVSSDGVNEDPNDQDIAAVPRSATEVAESSNARAREGRHRRPPSYLQDYYTGEDELNAMEVNHLEPTTYEEATQESKWKKAMDVEMQAIERNGTWDLVELPKDAKCIGVKWVFKTKVNERGEVEKHKARLVAKGYGQEHGVDYTEVYAPVARMDTIRLMIAVAAQRGWEIFQMDVKSAFLHGTLDEDVYVQQPQGYVIQNEEHKVYKLRKALYGLKQAPRAWFSRIESYFIKEGFERSNVEHTLFIKRNMKGNVLFVNVYVDDLIYTGDNMAMMQEFKGSMKREFEMTDLGKMRFFLGIEVLQTTRGIHISQRKYAAEILKRFKMEECNSVFCPIVPGCKLRSDEGKKMDETLFKQIIGSLMYITNTRPDIQYVVSLVSRFMSSPTNVHFEAAKKVLRYLQGTLDYGIWYERGGKGLMEVYTDSDFGGDVEDGKSTSGYVVVWDGGAVAWSSKKQKIVTLSSTEAEYVAATTCACQVLWMRAVLEDFGMKIKGSTTIKCDNMSTIKLSRNTVFHGRCKHIGVRYHFLRDLVKDGTIVLEHCGTRDQVADVMTKPLKKDIFEVMRKKLGMCSVKDKLVEENST
ncbi:putative RNA-directed DNA polymerase [Helianthus annuus]|nr:putative RNA-directed DNA polymerase [Helianthus annuus]